MSNPEIHVFQVPLPYDLYCRLKIRSFQTGIGIYEMCEIETEKFRKSLAKIITPSETIKEPEITVTV